MLLALLTVTAIHCKSLNGLPDPTCQPGVIDPTVTATMLCAKGYTTKTVRPPVSYTNKLKRLQIDQYGYSDKAMNHYEEDHLISLELAGSPKDPKNLWPESPPSPNQKDSVENWLHKMVCQNKISLKDAQQGIAKNWKQFLPIIERWRITGSVTEVSPAIGN